MESNTNISPLIVIAGPTGSGKTSLAIELAARFNGEIICADSRTVYESMNIGTAKPNAVDRQKVPHHLIDITAPDRPITVADFKILAQETIAEVASRGKVPFLVGGTGLYIDAFIYDFSFRGAPDYSARAEFETMSVGQLQERLNQLNLALPENSKNKRHLIRQIESGAEQPKVHNLRPNTLVIGLEVENELLAERIGDRLDDMFTSGLEIEARDLASKYGWDCKPMQTIGYQEFEPYFKGRVGLEDVKKAILRNTIRYAKRQRTWFKRNKHMRYIRKVDEAVDLITTFLNKKAAQ